MEATTTAIQQVTTTHDVISLGIFAVLFTVLFLGFIWAMVKAS